jgi:DNA-binding NarL/FixJ family response regulator
MRVLIADDSEILRTRLVEMLSEIEGIEIVAEAKDTKEAIETIKARHPDVVIMDIRMPGNDGIFAIETIKKGKKNKPRIIVFTNYPYLQYRKKCMDAGADFFFYKALEFEKLVKLLRDLARKN